MLTSRSGQDIREGLVNFDEILQEADGIILARGNLRIDLPPDKVFLFQKAAVYKCNMAGKPAVVTRVVDSMTDNLRPTRAEATDVANVVLDGADAILLGAETMWGLYPIETIYIVGKICVEVNCQVQAYHAGAFCCYPTP
ncbi:putative pyruvate kinase [Helianthus anomalus]